VLLVTGRLGILGGGQLALYLCEAAQALGVKVAVFAEPGDAPALERADRAFRAGRASFGSLDDFLAHCDVVTFDKEAIPEAILAHLTAAEKRGCIAARPGTATLHMLGDKALQKAWLVRHKLPTLPYAVLPANARSPHFLTQKCGAGIVQKVRCGGYDGRGVQVLTPAEATQQLWKVPSIVEPYLPGCLEIAVIVARTQSGEVECFPPVSMEFDAQLNSVRTVIMPAAIDTRQTEAAVTLARKTVDALDGVGVFAIEMFITAEGLILINEISPRVHNSGHVTLDACNVSQFEQHVRAVTGMPLVPVSLSSPAAMLNILYFEADRALYPVKPTATTLPDLDARVYWYGKTPGRAGRKMGHINSLGSDTSEALELAQNALSNLPRGCGGKVG
jgi:5-(carboxyamino)imidazole ribonucleotide synthase